MSVESLVGVNITNQDLYRTYRENMIPILNKMGGEFILDLVPDKILKSPVTNKFNRLFIISFPDEVKMNEFFDNPDYKKVRTKFFEPGVSETSIIRTYKV